MRKCCLLASLEVEATCNLPCHSGERLRVVEKSSTMFGTSSKKDIYAIETESAQSNAYTSLQ